MNPNLNVCHYNPELCEFVCGGLTYHVNSYSEKEYAALLQTAQPHMRLVKTIPMVAPYHQVDLLTSADMGLTSRYMAIHRENDSVCVLMALDYINGAFLEGNGPADIISIKLTACSYEALTNPKV